MDINDMLKFMMMDRFSNTAGNIATKYFDPNSDLDTQLKKLEIMDKRRSLNLPYYEDDDDYEEDESDYSKALKAYTAKKSTNILSSVKEPWTPSKSNVFWKEAKLTGEGTLQSILGRPNGSISNKLFSAAKRLARIG